MQRRANSNNIVLSVRVGLLLPEKTNQFGFPPKMPFNLYKSDPRIRPVLPTNHLLFIIQTDESLFLPTCILHHLQTPYQYPVPGIKARSRHQKYQHPQALRSIMADMSCSPSVSESYRAKRAVLACANVCPTTPPITILDRHAHGSHS